MVSRNVASHHSQERDERLGTAASIGAWELQNGLDNASQIAPSHGQARSGPAARGPFPMRHNCRQKLKVAEVEQLPGFVSVTVAVGKGLHVAYRQNAA